MYICFLKTDIPPPLLSLKQSMVISNLKFIHENLIVSLKLEVRYS